MTDIALSSNLLNRILTQFDDLKAKELLLYEDTKPEYTTDNGFRVRTSSFTESSSLKVMNIVPIPRLSRPAQEACPQTR